MPLLFCSSIYLKPLRVLFVVCLLVYDAEKAVTPVDDGISKQVVVDFLINIVYPINVSELYNPGKYPINI